MTFIRVDAEVDVETVLDALTDDHMIQELEHRGYEVVEESKDPLKELTDEEMDHLRDMVINGKPGTIEWSIYDKIRKR